MTDIVDQAPPAPEARIDLPPPGTNRSADLVVTLDEIREPTADPALSVGAATAVAEAPEPATQIKHWLRSDSGLAEGREAPRPKPRQLRQTTLDDKASLWGSLAASLALVWVLYERVLPFSGTLGFLICWFAAYLLLFSAVTALTYPLPMVVDRISSAVVTVGAGVVGFALVWTVVWIFVQGWRALIQITFYTQDMAGVGLDDPLSKGGVLHAIIGTGIQVLIATAIALPLGVITAVYMTEVGGRGARPVRTVVEAMTALPDILAGLFVYVVLIIALGWDKSGLAAAIALSVTMMPIIARSAEVVLRVVPGGLREASLALGASQWQTVRRVVLPTAKAGLATSLILGIARIAGETAPLLIVSGASSFLNANPGQEPMNSLPLFIYDAVRRPDGLTIQARGYGAAALLLMLVLVLFVLTRFLARDKGTRR